mmetsp:Transcript_8608/g.21756  ORF Transcript_8608/g.21756 Transcript_8608/m.21756 type:complete len:206 (-) Transcript_8608:190-807(-)
MALDFASLPASESVWLVSMPSQARLAMLPRATRSANHCHTSEASLTHRLVMSSPRKAMSTALPCALAKRKLRSAQARCSHEARLSSPGESSPKVYWRHMPASIAPAASVLASFGRKPIVEKSFISASGSDSSMSAACCAASLAPASAALPLGAASWPCSGMLPLAFRSGAGSTASRGAAAGLVSADGALLSITGFFSLTVCASPA